MISFSAKVDIIGVNPFVYLPDEVLESVFTQTGRSKGPIPVRGTVNERPYQQTLVKYCGSWRLYINLKMLDKSPSRVGETIAITIEADPAARTLAMPPPLAGALRETKAAQLAFDRLSVSRQKEIIRYIANLKTEASVARNVARAIDFLLGKGRFAGRAIP